MGVGGARNILARLASTAPVRVFVLAGSGAGEIENLVAALALDHEVVLLDSPRSASILLAIGDLPPSLHEPARRIHDQMSHPRRTIRVRRPIRDEPDAIFPGAIVHDTSAGLAMLLRQVHRELLTGVQLSEPAILPNEETASWCGVGPYGQGGTGMTGGVPYGRPMAEISPDRDGLALDQLSFRAGPFFPPFPAGLTLVVKLQGDIVQQVSVTDNPFVTTALTSDADSGITDPFALALERPVPIADLEMARARHHVRWLAHALHVQGLDALARRSIAIARSLRPGGVAPLAELIQTLRRTRNVALAGAGVGIAAADRVRERGLGPVARAAGLREDGRAEDMTYRALGFEPLVQLEGDTASRWWQRLAEARQSLELAARAGNLRTGGNGRIEGPRGLLTIDADPSVESLGLIPDLLTGLEWGDAVISVVSLDLELRVKVIRNAA